jgi:hypothetical protein
VSTPGEHGAVPLRPRVRDQLRAKLPEILLEAASVVLAVLLALAVDQWREARSNRELAARARRSIVAELDANRRELEGSFEANQRALEQLRRTLDALEAHPDMKDMQVQLGVSLAELSDAAWQTARSTQAPQFLDFDWLIRVARIYERQALYESTQRQMLDHVSAAISEFATARSPAAIVGPFRGRLQTFQDLAVKLQQGYDDVLEREDGQSR